MRWVAPTEKDEANHQLEKRLWDAADQFRANSGLKAGELAGIYLGKRENDIRQLVHDGELQEVKNGKPEAS